NRRSHRYASFLRLAAEEIILRQYSRNLIFAVLGNILRWYDILFYYYYMGRASSSSFFVLFIQF
ncbi:MAG: hypothetical protein E6109_16365, partial [Ruminococcus sp.]|nr:hypothetical protein [Ruminococcus sp.]